MKLQKTQTRARIPRFYKLPVDERIKAARERGWLNLEDYRALATGQHTLNVRSADRMIENVIGVQGLPIGLGLNFLVNGSEYVVPLVVEEPSIVAALSSAAKRVRECGGFEVTSTESLLIGQIQVVDVPHMAQAKAAILQRKEEIINLANSLHPNMVARGGGARDLELRIHPPSGVLNKEMMVVHLMVDTCDAMGANLVNTMCEGVASLVESITSGSVFLRILSNLTDRALVTARCRIPVAQLAENGYSGEQVRDGIILANDFASIDPYRAATHNKGIMNGIDPVAIATGNDWRAIEAAAHAYAARGGRYTSLTRWEKDEQGNLLGTLEIPMKVGIVGGSLQSNPSVGINHRLLGIESARELAEVMGAVGLAQNFSAIRALSTDGIQKGHMTLHARSVASSAGASSEIFEQVVDRLIEDGEIKIWKAREIIGEIQKAKRPMHAVGSGRAKPTEEEYSAGHGKVILLGEHAVVYGAHAMAAPVPLAVRAKVDHGNDGIEFIMPRWGVEQRLARNPEQRQSFEKPIALILEKLDLIDRNMKIEVFPNVPRAMGLGSSAAIAVAIARALNQHFRLGLTDEDIRLLAFECEKVAHGTPSGLDNTVATYGQFVLFQKGEPLKMQPIKVDHSVPLVIGMSGVESLTAKMVARVRQAWQRSPARYEQIFQSIDTLTMEGVEAIRNNRMEELGELMNICQGYLNSLQVSSWEVEELIQIARENGAAGAKLTGGGGGGSIVAVCPDGPEQVVRALHNAGYQAMEVNIGKQD